MGLENLIFVCVLPVCTTYVRLGVHASHSCIHVTGVHVGARRPFKT